MDILKGDTVRNTRTGEFGTAKSSAKQDGTVSVKLPSFRGGAIVQWLVEEVEVQQPGF